MEQIITIVMPIVISVIGFLVAGATIINKVKTGIKEIIGLVKNKEEQIETLQSDMKHLILQNAELESKYNELLTELTKIKHGD